MDVEHYAISLTDMLGETFTRSATLPTVAGKGEAVAYPRGGGGIWKSGHFLGQRKMKNKKSCNVCHSQGWIQKRGGHWCIPPMPHRIHEEERRVMRIHFCAYLARRLQSSLRSTRDKKKKRKVWFIFQRISNGRTRYAALRRHGVSSL